MTATLIIVPATCLTLIADILIKPSVSVRGHNFSLYWLFPLFGAAALVTSGAVPIGELVGSITADTAINPLKILVLFLSMAVMSVFLDEVGFFRYLACVALKKAKTSQLTLFTYLYLTVSVLTVFTSNDIIILTFTPFICYFAANAKIDPVPYLFAEFVAANTWSMFLVIGNPTNVYLATANGVDFAKYVSVMALPTLAGGLTAFAVLYLVFHKKLKKPIEGTAREERIESKGLLLIGLLHLGFCTVLLAVSSYIGLEMWLVTLMFAVSLFLCAAVWLVRKRKSCEIVSRCLKRAPWELIPFVLSMFVLVFALERAGLTRLAASWLGESATVWKYGAASFLSANLVNNIPMSVLFSSVLQSAPQSVLSEAVYACVAGSNVCAFFTPVGALAGIMWSGILKKQGVRFSFASYVRYGAVIAVPTLIAVLGTLSLL